MTRQHDQPQPASPRSGDPHGPGASRRTPMTPAERAGLLADVDAYCTELRPIEELCYVDAIVALAKKHDLRGWRFPERMAGGRRTP